MSTASSASPLNPQPSGAHAIDDDGGHRKRPWWLLALLALLVIAGLILLLSRCGGGKSNGASGTSPAPNTTAVSTPDTTSSSPTDTSSPTVDPSTSAAPSTSPTAGPTNGSGTSVLTAGGTSLLPLSTSAATGGALTDYVGRNVTAKGVEVLGAPAPNGFWIGTSVKNRVWVHLVQKGLVQPHPVRAGDHLSFTGRMVANKAGFARHSGLETKTGVQQLAAEKAHIQVKKSDITFD